MIKLKAEEFPAVARFVLEVSGIHLDGSKSYLIETRLSPLLGAFHCQSYSDLAVRARSNPTLERKIIDAISTNETLFFRDRSPFEALQHKIIPDLIDRKTKNGQRMLPPTIRIWSAACSTGQEPYSLAMLIRELCPDDSKHRFQLVGTDISDAAVARASHGVYNRFEVERGLEPTRLSRYFSPLGDGYRIRDEIRSMVTFRKLNLLKPFTGMGRFDVILCRNVAIYFTPEDRKRLFERLADMLEPEGYLIIGSTESLTGVCARFAPQRHVRAVFYQVKPENRPVPGEARRP